MVSDKPFEKGQTYSVKLIKQYKSSELLGGTLLLSPLFNEEGKVRAVAQGTLPLSNDEDLLLEGVKIVN